MKKVALCFVLIFAQYISIINGDVDDIPISIQQFRRVKNAMDFTGKVALITGSNSGLGSATAQLLSYLGAKVVVTGRNATRVKEVANKCRSLSPCGHNPLALALDLTIKGNVAKLLDETIEAYGRIDILVNNAGIGKLAGITDSNYRNVLEAVRAINEDVPIELTQLAVPFIEATNGTIIFTTSLFARNPVPFVSAYSMGKNALIGFVLTLMHELGSNVRVNVISPTVFDGTRIFRLLDPIIRQTLIANQIKSSSLKREGAPLDFASTVAYLASPLASFINGKEIQLDGGLYTPML